MSLPGDVVLNSNKVALPPVKRISKFLPRRSALCSPDTYEQFVLSDNSNEKSNYISLIGKKTGDSVRSDPVLLPCMSSDPLLRITQLEQNLRFLQEQHQSMLNSLHQEIESLRVRNRDLQFQLIFGNPPISHLSSDSSPEDVCKPKIVLSPKEVNTRPLQVEMLEKEVAELKASLNEANTKNANLAQLVEYQKKQLDTVKKEKDSEHSAKLDDAETLIKRLVKENEEQRKEINNMRTQLSKSSGNGSRYNGGGRRGGGGGSSGGDYQRFPPLQTQNFWGHGSQKQRTSPDYHNGRGQMDHEVVGQPAPSLPHLTRTYSQPSQNQRIRYFKNGNHFYHGNGADEGEGRRRYRGKGGAGNSHKEDN